MTNLPLRFMRHFSIVYVLYYHILGIFGHTSGDTDTDRCFRRDYHIANRLNIHDKTHSAKKQATIEPIISEGRHYSAVAFSGTCRLIHRECRVF